MKVVGIVPARGGSKGIPLKNLAPCNGKPLIYWTIKEAKRSSLDALYVSTDCEQIAEYAADMGVDILWRPALLASDTARTIDVLQFHLQTQIRARAASNAIGYDAVFTLQPTNPLRTATMIDNACCLLEDGGLIDSVISFTDVGERHPARMKQLATDGTMFDPPFAEGMEGQPRQTLERFFVRTGEVYLSKLETILAGSLKGERCLPFFLDKSEAWNVDDATDLLIVEALMKARGA